MGFIGMNHNNNGKKPRGTEQTLDKNNKDKSEQRSVSVILQNDEKIFEQLEDISRKIDAIDKNNKKFLMTASVNKIEEQDKRITSMKKSIISILDQIDILISTMYDVVDEKMRVGIDMTIRAIDDNVYELDIEEILVRIGDEFNPDIHKCLETSYDLNMNEDIVTALVKKGYKDKTTGIVIRPAEVVVNKR